MGVNVNDTDSNCCRFTSYGQIMDDHAIGCVVVDTLTCIYLFKFLSLASVSSLH